MERTRHSPIAGFTLLELLVALTVLLAVIGAGFNIFNGILKANNKATVTNEVRQNGQLAMAIVERVVRNATDVVRFVAPYRIVVLNGNQVVDIACDPTSNPIRNGVIYVNYTKITNDDRISGVHLADCGFEVDKSVWPPIVKVSFTFEQSKFAPNRKDFTARVTLNGTFSLRNVVVR